MKLNQSPAETGTEQEVPKKKKPGTFTSDDPRINRAGRTPGTPSNPLKVLAEQIAARKIKLPPKRKKYLGLDKEEVTVLEAIITDWAMSLNPVKQQAFIERLFGKVPNQNINTNQNVDIVMKYKSKFTDAELENIANGADALEILFNKIPDVEETEEEET